MGNQFQKKSDVNTSLAKTGMDQYKAVFLGSGEVSQISLNVMLNWYSLLKITENTPQTAEYLKYLKYIT